MTQAPTSAGTQAREAAEASARRTAFKLGGACGSWNNGQLVPQARQPQDEHAGTPLVFPE